METNILLESGTNELEILEFKVGSIIMGLMLLRLGNITLSDTNTSTKFTRILKGIFMPREDIITIVNLGRCLNFPKENTKK